MNSPILGDELGALSTFAVVAEERSFTRAAVKLGVSRSAVSHAVRALEDRLGLRLLARTTRSVAPTDAGDRLLDQLRPALSGIAAAISDVGRLRDTPAGVVRLIAPPIVLATLLSPKLAPFAREYPDVALDITSEDDTRGDHRMGAFGPVYRWEFEKRGKPVTVSVSGPLTVNDAEFLIRAALDGVGLAFLIEDHVAEHIARGALVRVLEDWCPPFDGYFLYYPSRRHQPPALQALVDALRV